MLRSFFRAVLCLTMTAGFHAQTNPGQPVRPGDYQPPVRVVGVGENITFN